MGRPRIESSVGGELPVFGGLRMPLELTDPEWKQIDEILSRAVETVYRRILPDISDIGSDIRERVLGLDIALAKKAIRQFITSRRDPDPNIIDLSTPKSVQAPKVPDEADGQNDARIEYLLRNKRRPALDLLHELQSTIERLMVDENIFPDTEKGSPWAYRVGYSDFKAPNIVPLLELKAKLTDIMEEVRRLTEAAGRLDAYCACGCGRLLQPGRTKYAYHPDTAAACEKHHASQIKRWRDATRAIQVERKQRKTFRTK